MTVRYWFPPGTDAEISRSGGPFVAFKSETLLTFAWPSEESAADFIFNGDGWQVRVSKSRVYRCEWDGNGGRNVLCG